MILYGVYKHALKKLTLEVKVFNSISIYCPTIIYCNRTTGLPLNQRIKLIASQLVDWLCLEGVNVIFVTAV